MPSFDPILARPRTHPSKPLSPHHSQHRTRVPFRPHTLAFPPSTIVACGRACDVELPLPAIPTASAQYVSSLSFHISHHVFDLFLSRFSHVRLTVCSLCLSSDWYLAVEAPASTSPPSRTPSHSHPTSTSVSRRLQNAHRHWSFPMCNPNRRLQRPQSATQQQQQAR